MSEPASVRIIFRPLDMYHDLRAACDVKGPDTGAAGRFLIADAVFFVFLSVAAAAAKNAGRKIPIPDSFAEFGKVWLAPDII